MSENRRKIFFLLNFVFVLVLALMATWEPTLKGATGDTVTYTVTLDSTSPAQLGAAYGGGSKQSRYVLFDYADAMDASGYHTRLKSGSGAIYNDASTPITSITKVTAVFTGSLILTTGDSANPTGNSTVLGSGVDYVLSTEPYFFKVTAGAAETYITSLSICYTCVEKVSSSEETSASYAIEINDFASGTSTNNELSSAFTAAPLTYLTLNGPSLSSVSSSQLYASLDLQGFKLGSGSNIGTLSFVFSAAFKMDTVTLSVSPYNGTETTTVSVTDGINTKTGIVSTGVSSLTYALGSSTSSSTLTIASTTASSSKRFNVYGLTILGSGSGTVSSSSSQSASSSSASSSASSSSQSSSSSSSSTSSSASSSSSVSSSSASSSSSYGYTYVTPNYSGSYYDTISTSASGTTLRNALDTLLDSDAYTNFSYSGMANVYKKTDVDPTNSSNLIGFYSGTSSYFSGSFVSSGTGFNREHVWPNSRGGGNVEDDPHMVRPTLVSDNSSRGNDFYNLDPTSWDPGTHGLEKYRGIAARIIFYCAVKEYESGLNLVDLTTDSTSNLSMGKLSTLLAWNLAYDIDWTETERNEALVTNWGHCRNPFIDDRNYACRIWGSTDATTKSVCGMA